MGDGMDVKEMVLGVSVGAILLSMSIPPIIILPIPLPIIIFPIPIPIIMGTTGASVTNGNGNEVGENVLGGMVGATGRFVIIIFPIIIIIFFPMPIIIIMGATGALVIIANGNEVGKNVLGVMVGATGAFRGATVNVGL